MKEVFLFTFSLCVCFWLSFSVSCSKSSLEQDANGIERQDDSLVYSKMDDASNGNIGSVRDSYVNPPSILFCGFRGTGMDQRYKVVSSDGKMESWLKKGDEVNGFIIRGIDDKNSLLQLILEREGFWYLYSLSSQKNESSQNDISSTPHIINEEDIPEGVDVMKYIEKNTIPANSSEMPDDMPVINDENSVE